nr:hypothetical protein CFP56_65506 [Quercus suber]
MAQKRRGNGMYGDFAQGRRTNERAGQRSGRSASKTSKYLSLHLPLPLPSPRRRLSTSVGVEEVQESQSATTAGGLVKGVGRQESGGKEEGSCRVVFFLSCFSSPFFAFGIFRFPSCSGSVHALSFPSVERGEALWSNWLKNLVDAVILPVLDLGKGKKTSCDVCHRKNEERGLAMDCFLLCEYSSHLGHDVS